MEATSDWTDFAFSAYHEPPVDRAAENSTATAVYDSSVHFPAWRVDLAIGDPTRFRKNRRFLSLGIFERS